VVVVVDSVVLGLEVVVVVVDSDVVPLGLAAGATFSVFCSHATSSAAPAKMQMYFFIVFGIENAILSQ
jgi:hydrogenase/urease accessory protein HupE